MMEVLDEGVLATAVGRNTPVEKDILQILDGIKDPCSVATSVPMGLNEMGLIRSVAISPVGQVHIELRLTSPFCEMIAFMRNTAIEKVGSLPGVTGVSVGHDNGLDWDPDMIAPEAQSRRQRRLALLRELPTPAAGTAMRPSRNG